MDALSRPSARLAIGAACLAAGANAHAIEDLEYVSEHLPEAAMNYRVATLPLWSPASKEWSFKVQGAWGSIRSDRLSLSGPLSSVAAQRRIADRWTLTGFGFYDRLKFSGDGGLRPLEVRFARPVPLDLPADAEFGRAGGSATDFGAGLAVGYDVAGGWMRDWRVTLGGHAQRLELTGYAFPYSLLNGSSAGSTGLVDYSGQYTFLNALIGTSRRFERNDWAFTPHILLALPVLRRGVQGRITGPGFNIAGDTSNVGQGRHYGDAAITFGLELEYRPWRASLDIGSLLTQTLMEPAMHKGVDRSLLLSLTFRP